MALVFNPFTGNFDNVIASSSEMSMSDGTLTVNGDINLDDGGAFSTTVQAVTPTQDRTISFPDATGTVALVNGANGTIQYNDAGTLKGNSDFTVDPDWNDAATVFTGLKLNVTDGAGGSPVGAAASNLLDLQSGGTSKLNYDGNNLRITPGTASGQVSFGNDSVFIRRTPGGNNLELGCGGSSINLQSNVLITDAKDIAVGTTTGTKIGTATTQKLSFYNATPVVQPTAVADATDAVSVITQLNALLDRMRDLGLIAT